MKISTAQQKKIVYARVIPRKKPIVPIFKNEAPLHAIHLN
jgi:hypothetical protein